MNKKYIIVFVFLLTPLSTAHAEHVLNIDAYGQYLDISQLEAEKFVLDVDGNSYDMYYGYHGSLDAMGSEFHEPTVTGIVVNQERQSLEITFADVAEKTDFWIRMPFEVIFAEKEDYQVLVDGIDTGYDLMKFPNDYVVGLIISENTQHVEIIGTRVIPEFGVISILVLGLAVLGIVYMARKFPFGPSWTRIN